jgi:glycosyltransferase involved in cell wall biosynthesis
VRLLQVINTIDPADGGPVETVIQLTQALCALGDKVEILVIRGPSRLPPDIATCVPLHHAGAALARYSFSPTARAWLYGNVARFDGVVIHGIWQYGTLAAGRAARVRGVPYFIYPHGALDAALPSRYPVRHLKKRVYWRLVGRDILASAAGVCFTTPMEMSRATAYDGAWHGVLVGAGTTAPREFLGEELKSRFPVLRGARVMLFLGRLDPIKGIDLLIGAFSTLCRGHPEAALVLAGRGTPSYVERLHQLAHAKGCSGRVIHAGPLYGPDKWTALREADVLIVPSHRDSFGVVVAEALAVGTPVVLTDKVGTSAMVARYGAGIVCTDNEDDLRRALLAWMASDRASMALAARRCYEENYRAETAAQALRSAISGAMRTPGPSIG